jgi:uncharacterized protein (DUF427 family)
VYHTGVVVTLTIMIAGAEHDAETAMMLEQSPIDATECVWDYPRPPIVVPSPARVRVVHRGVVVADSTSTLRVLETSHPPTYYIPRFDARQDVLVPSRSSTVCEWKGLGTYWSLRIAGHVELDVAWGYRHPRPGFRAIAGHLAFYAQRVDECWVDDEQVQPSPGLFYGGWITSAIEGPFKGSVGTERW